MVGKVNVWQTVQKVLVVFLALFAVAAATLPLGWGLLAAAVGALATAINEVLPTGPLTTLLDAVLAALGHAVPAAKAKLAVRRAGR